MIDRFYEVYLRRLRAIRDDFVKLCVDNSLNSMEDYRFINGNIQALTRAEDLVKEVYSEVYEEIVIKDESEKDFEI